MCDRRPALPRMRRSFRHWRSRRSPPSQARRLAIVLFENGVGGAKRNGTRTSPTLCSPSRNGGIGVPQVTSPLVVLAMLHSRSGALASSTGRRAAYGVKCVIGALIRSPDTVANMSAQPLELVSRNDTTARWLADGVTGSGKVRVAGMLKRVPSGRKSNTMPFTVVVSGSVAAGFETSTVIVTSWLSAPGGMTSVAPPAVTVPPAGPTTVPRGGGGGGGGGGDGTTGGGAGAAGGLASPSPPPPQATSVPNSAAMKNRRSGSLTYMTSHPLQRRCGAIVLTTLRGSDGFRSLIRRSTPACPVRSTNYVGWREGAGH